MVLLITTLIPAEFFKANNLTEIFAKGIKHEFAITLYRDQTIFCST